MGLLDQLFRKAAHELANDVKQNAKQNINTAINTKTETFVFQSLPQTLEELKALPEADLKSPFKAAALTVLALNMYPTNREACFEMMEFLNGPDDLSNLDKSKINDRFMDGRSYVARSYFEGATPENNYAPKMPYTIKVIQSAHSNDTLNEGYVTLYIQSGGADGPRNVRLRTKPSTGQWFVNQFEGLLASIRIPKAEDKWA